MVVEVLMVLPLASLRLNTGCVVNAELVATEPAGCVVNEIWLMLPALMVSASEQAVIEPTAAPMRTTWVLRTFTPEKLATPLESVTGLLVALIPWATRLVQPVSE